MSTPLNCFSDDISHMNSAPTILDGEVPRKPGVSQDPFIGGRIRHEFGEAQNLTLLADVGGFGVDSDLSWQAIATYAFDVTFLGTPLNTIVGYRSLAVDHRENGPFGENGLDLIEHGPILGVNLRW